VSIRAPANTRALVGVDPVRLARVARAREPLRGPLMAARWCVTIWPTPALAQEAGMDDEAYAAFVERALFLDRDDPVAAWRELSERQARLVDRLSRACEIRIEAEGTDLRLRVDGRTWINSDGRRNMPSGEVFTGPHEDSAQGCIRFSVPTGPAGVEVAGVCLEFAAGRVVSATARRGQDYLEAALATDPGARVLGELGIGTNPGIDRATGSILLDEKIAGTVHLALGRSYPETGGTNASALHWDLICDLRPGGRLSADGETIVESGEVALK
jgi:aminopeptidase